MLTRIFIQNLATVEKQIIKFDSGFTVLTGETGAGKSVIIKAVNLILGGKCPKDLIRVNEKFLSVEAVFQIDNNPAVLDLLDELDIEHEGELTIRRKVHVSGKNSVFINDYTSNLVKLSLLGEHLLDLHGQHSQQALLKTSTHIDYLDEFSGIKEKVNSFKSTYLLLEQKKKQKQELEQDGVDRNRKIDFIRFQIDEIDRAGLTEDEDVQLNNEARLLNNGEKLITALSPVVDWNSDENSPLVAISSALQQIKEITKIDSRLQSTADEIQSGLITLEEASSDIKQYLGNLEINPQRLEEINSRLSELDNLKRKYGDTVEDIFTYRESQIVELKSLESLETSFEELEKEIEKLKQTIQKNAGEISKSRKKAVKDFEKLVLSGLHELGLERSKFKTEITSLSKDENSEQTYTAKGSDRVEFMIATNPGNPLKPLAKIASGGEISRIMLAIKTTLNEDISLNSMIFDEIDSGISGRVAETVGFKLVKLSLDRQVICITHSPQIAAKAMGHLRVEKKFKDNSSITLIKDLDDNERIEEIARFLGGNEISEKTLSVARDMLTKKN